MDKQISNNKERKISWGFAACLVAVMAATAVFSCKSNTAQQGQQATLKTDSVNAAHDTLVAQVNAARMQIDELTSKTNALDSDIAKKDVEIAKLEKDVKHLSRKNRALLAQLKKDKKLIKSLRDELSDKATEIAGKLGALQTDNEGLKRQRDSIMLKYTAIKALGSVLHVSGFRLEPLRIKHNGRKERKTERARKVNDLRIYFDIDENRIAEDGVKDLYLVVTGPGGKLLSSSANSSGTITDHEGKTISFSILKQISLKTGEPVKNIQVDWKQDAEYERGAYNITIYNGGYKIGGGSVGLR